jgi:glycosyltransferase involved in cell wall biosynthesis
MKKICFVISSLATGGAERVVLNLAEELHLIGCEVHIVLLKNIIKHEVNYSSCIIHTLSETGRLSKVKIINNILLLKELRKLISNEEKNKEFDLIVSNLVDADKICVKLKHKNLYFCIHNSESNKLKGKSFLKKYKVKCRYDNKKLITVSKGLADDILNKLEIKPKELVTIYNPFNRRNIIELAAKNDSFNFDDEYIIHVGRFTKQKRHDVLLKAYKLSGIKEKLVLLGDYTDSDYNGIVEIINKLKLDGQVILLNFVKNPYPYIKNSKLLVLSSDYEGFGNVLAEALILNTMVVSTDCPSGPSEILVDELKPFLSKPGDIQGLANNIKKAIDSPITISPKFIEKFDAKSIAKQYLKLCHLKT